MSIHRWIKQLLSRAGPNEKEPTDQTSKHGKILTAHTESTSNGSKPRIAIIGAGIGGLALAIGLVKEKIPFTLYESAAVYSTVGAGVGLGPNALNAMDLIDKSFRKMYNDISSGNLTPNKDHVMMDLAYAEDDFGAKRGWEPLGFGAKCYDRTSAHRKDLLSIMTDLIPIENVRFNKRVKLLQQEGLENDGGKRQVRIEFEDGEVAFADAVIGSDGAKGPCRGFVLGDSHPDKIKATYSGKYVYRSIIPMEDALKILGHMAGDAMSFTGKGVNFVSFPISNGTQCNLVAFKFSDTPWTHPQWTHQVTKEEMVSDFADGVDRRIVKLLDWANPLKWSLWHHYDTPIYYKNLICLLGDSAHATTPHQASGAGQCLEDALILSRLLGLVASSQMGRYEFEIAFKIYDEIRRPRAQRVVQTSQEAGQLYSFSHSEYKEDMMAIYENLKTRFLWIWEHDLKKDVETAESKFWAATA